MQSILDRGPDPEAAWLLSRVYLQEGDKARALAALKQAGSYRADNPLEAEPGPYVGEARCEKCHAAIFRDSLASRHTQTYYRGAQLDDLPCPDRPLPDPDDPEVTHTIHERDGVLREETRVGREVFDAVIEYAFGTSDRYLTTVSRDASGGYHIARLSYYDTPEGKGWDRSALDKTHPSPDSRRGVSGRSDRRAGRPGEVPVLPRDQPAHGRDSIGPETADRAIGCERCHGPGGNHIAAPSRPASRTRRSSTPRTPPPRPSRASNATTATSSAGTSATTTRANPAWVRSQGVGWTLSRCNTESGGAFGCVTCHDPHKSARATTTAEYEAKCLSCHAATGRLLSAAAYGARARGSGTRRPRDRPRAPAR